MNNQAEIIDEVLTELNRARTKFPTWPDDPIHAAAVVAEESGELVQATLQACYEQKRDEPSFQAQLSKVRQEAIQTAAMAIRFLVSLDRYVFAAGSQHEQVGDETAVSRLNRCPACGDDRTGKGSLISAVNGGQAFCNELCYEQWQQGVLDEAVNP